MMYHHVGPLRPGTYPSLTVSPKNFERQIRWLAHCGYVGIQPSQWLRWRRDGTELPDKPILITFDDAYEDITEYALPILRRFGFGAAVYVVTGRLGGTNSWDEADGCGTLKLMSADQVRYWAGQGIEFGPHSQTHADLTKLSEAECEAEIVGSKNDLVALLGSPIVSFAYPFGECNNYIRDLVREHFELGFGTEEGMNYLRSDPHILRRTYVGPKQSLFSFFISVRRGGKGIIRYLRAKFGVRTRLKRILGRL
jgi:peptidoglycan/xylan/chitin deacetylase (PgdA/CDA1 family)